jgi:hypothetical protein
MKKCILICGLMLLAMLPMSVQAASMAVKSLEYNATINVKDLGNGELLINYNNATMNMNMLGENATVLYDQQLHVWKNGTFIIQMTGRGNLTNTTTAGFF